MIDTKTASLEELTKFATDTLGLEVGEGADIDALRKTVEQALGEPETIDPNARVRGQINPDTAARGTASKAVAEGEDEYTIVIPEVKGERQDVIVGVNGVNVQIKRGEEARVKARYVEALQHANFREVDQETLEEAGGKVMSYPFSILQHHPAKKRRGATKKA